MDKFVPPSVFNRRGLKNHTFLVTGGAHGIGKATVHLLASLGADVIALDMNTKFLDRLEEGLTAPLRERVVAMEGDVTRKADMVHAIGHAEKTFGRLDGLVNNAMGAGHGPMMDQTDANMTRVWQTNVLAAWRNIKLAMPMMQQQGSGAVVNLSSVMVQRVAWPALPYVSSKAGLEGLTRELAVELGPMHIRVNTIAPGAIDTREKRDWPNPGVPEKVWAEYRQTIHELRSAHHHTLQPWPCPGRPDAIANAICFLLSDAAWFITGAMLRVDGGSSCWDGAFKRELPPEVESLCRRLEELREAHPILATLRYRRKGKGRGKGKGKGKRKT